ncbi:hypothetical protein ACH4KU_33160 [Streptomyces althioticus]|uniref:hypothetical protein n=1 Tax=Streptomyces althioticus TaxID=83380 RepID=UPI0033CC061C
MANRPVWWPWPSPPAAGLRVPHLQVRDLGDRARVEVDPALVSRTVALPALGEVLAAAGFAGLPHQVEPFRSGRLNTES